MNKTSLLNQAKKHLNKDKRTKLNNEEICKIYQEGNRDILEMLCVKNQGLLYSRAYKYNKVYNNKLDIDDLFQCACLGMMKAAEKFDNSLGTKFTTYAVWWIDQSINRSIIDEGFTIRLPVHIFENISKVEAISRLDYSLSQEELIEKLEDSLDYDRSFIEKLLELSKHTLNPTSLYTPVGKEGDTYLMDFLEADFKDNVESIVEQMELELVLNNILQTLTPREQSILEMRYGLKGNEPHTLQEVGEKEGVTRERIRQIEAKALGKLRQPSRGKFIKEFYSDE